jgi:hypothetical protein
MLTSLILVGVGAALGAIAAVLVGWRKIQQWYEYEAYSSYLVGFASGRSQGRSDAKRMGVVWVERN